MKNSEKYKTSAERADAFFRYYNGYIHDAMYEFSKWLDLEAKVDDPLPCPFCGRTNIIIQRERDHGNGDMSRPTICCEYCGAMIGLNWDHGFNYNDEVTDEPIDVTDEQINKLLKLWNNRTSKTVMNSKA